MASVSACDLFGAVCNLETMCMYGSYLHVDKSLREMGAVGCFYVGCEMDTKTYLYYMGLRMKC
jgi:hypothetical protein